MNRYPIDDRELAEYLQRLEHGFDDPPRPSFLRRAAEVFFLVLAVWAVIGLAGLGAWTLLERWL